MSDDTTADHRGLGVRLFNATWDLLEADRDGDADLTMLLTAAASRWHWDQVGGAAERATGDWQVARVLGELGAGDLALRFAERALATATADDAAGWRLASVHEGVARAHHVRGDTAARDQHVRAARAALAAEPDPDDRTAIAAQLADLAQEQP